MPYIAKDYIVGNMMIGPNKGFYFMISIKRELMHKIKVEDYSLNDINFPIGVMNDSILVSYIDMEQLSADKKDDVDPDVKKHIKEGGIVLLLNSLN